MEAIWTNPMPLGQGREASLRVVMQAMMEGKDFTEEEKVVMRQMWFSVLAGEKKLEDFRHLTERTTPPAIKTPQKPITRQKKAGNVNLFN